MLHTDEVDKALEDWDNRVHITIRQWENNQNTFFMDRTITISDLIVLLFIGHLAAMLLL